MISPVVILESKFQEILDKIQSFIPYNEIIYKAIKQYFTHLRKKMNYTLNLHISNIC